MTRKTHGNTSDDTKAVLENDVEGKGGFLSRWSRLKRDRQASPALASEVAVEAAMDGVNALQPVSEDQADSGAILQDAQPSAAEERARKERDEFLASLPRLEDISASTDVTGFMNALVPDVLRNAALRAAWSADPSIRDFLNDAREYALDYNTPGAAYGYGPLTESDIAGLDDMVRGIFGDAPKPEPEPETNDTLVGDRIGDSDGASDTSPHLASAAPQKLQEAHDLTSSVRFSDSQSEHLETAPKATELAQDMPDLGLDTGQKDDAALQHRSVAVAATLSDHSLYRRRGGGAMPQ
jgi:hypothetical protein